MLGIKEKSLIEGELEKLKGESNIFGTESIMKDYSKVNGISVEVSDIKGILDEMEHNDNERYIKPSFEEVAEMESPIPPWGIICLKGPSIENIRRSFFEFRSKGAVLFDLRFDSFDPRGTPESRARFGVQILQTASFLRNSSIASLRPERFGGMVQERFLSEGDRIAYLRTIASQGFSWMEIEIDIERPERDEIIKLARSKGSKIILTQKLSEMVEWTPPENVNTDEIDCFKVLVPVKDSLSFKRSIRTSKNVRKWSEDLKVVIEPININNGISQILSAISMSDFVYLKPWEIMGEGIPLQQGQKPQDRISIWNSLGLIGTEATKQWSMWKRELTQETSIFLQMGRLENCGFRNRVFNSHFNLLSMDAMMIPWTSEVKDLPFQLQYAGSMGMRGLFIEMPLRSSAVGMMDWMDPRSLSVGSIDVVSFRGGKSCGFNSELYGIGDQIHSTEVARSSRTLVIGTGASGRAAAVASSMMGMETYLAGSNPEKAREVSSKLGGKIKGTSFKALTKPGMKFDLIINSVPFETRTVSGGKATSMEIVEIVRGLEPSFGMDLYYRLQWTPFLSSIESRGGVPVSGVDILLKSTQRAFSLLTGTDGLEPSLRESLQETLLV
jgi:shikimate dehydrogenase